MAKFRNVIICQVHDSFNKFPFKFICILCSSDSLLPGTEAIKVQIHLNVTTYCIFYIINYNVLPYVIHMKSFS